jgi:hypothetical protein
MPPFVGGQVLALAAMLTALPAGTAELRRAGASAALAAGRALRCARRWLAQAQGPPPFRCLRAESARPGSGRDAARAAAVVWLLDFAASGADASQDLHLVLLLSDTRRRRRDCLPVCDALCSHARKSAPDPRAVVRFHQSRKLPPQAALCSTTATYPDDAVGCTHGAGVVCMLDFRQLCLVLGMRSRPSRTTPRRRSVRASLTTARATEWGMTSCRQLT